ncbi:hypothetical protein [Pseudobacteriovorax antillogorgiicola]|uniref:EF-hand domain-containing protein n=1 Tax=Pseudobacteriovorax antillogorgiicola TaxID=1513793 RepID=A0A1Y6BPQ6_9BACT|nr:hypothetical protein [Pseudobacteriovorax antillogorgiicola]TCS53822.1 hypothetical protein EDD56_107131 [Pseudobacteriovorax antillogorgiicola]SMF21853.1 hypothetical protein SAMN06296036_107141 [Pseudobacteriovorax antillogorgiicola]
MRIRLSSMVVLHFVFAVSCGTNTFEQIESSKDTAEEASRALDDQNYSKAISILETALQDEPNNYQYTSLLASAKAQQAGVDTMDFALSMASSGGIASIVGLFDVVPDASNENIVLMQEAVALMDSIPLAEQIAADQFKASMFYTSLMTMQTKALDTDGDGVLSSDELAANLSESNASDIINSIVGAENALASYTAEDGTATAASNVSQIKSDIDNQEGSSDAERLRNYLEAA